MMTWASPLAVSGHVLEQVRPRWKPRVNQLSLYASPSAWFSGATPAGGPKRGLDPALGHADRVLIQLKQFFLLLTILAVQLP